VPLRIIFYYTAAFKMLHMECHKHAVKLIIKGECQCSSSNKNAVETILVNETISTFTTPGYRVAYYP
jgi:hypothetical protein